MIESETPEEKRHPKVQAIMDYLPDDDELLFADGLEDAIIGLAELPCRPSVVAYDRKKCIEILAAGMTSEGEGPEDEDEGGMTPWQRAEEYFESNTVGAFVGERTPVYLTLLADMETT